MKRLFILLVAAMITVSGMGQTAKKSQNAKSSSQNSAPKTVYIEAKKTKTLEWEK